MPDDSQDAIIWDRDRTFVAMTTSMGHVYLLRDALARRKIVSPSLSRVYLKMRYCMEYASYGSLDVVCGEGVSWQCRRILNDRKCPCEFSCAAEGDGILIMRLDELNAALSGTETPVDVAYEIARTFQQSQFEIVDKYEGMFDLFDLLGRLFVLTPNVPRKSERRADYQKLNSITFYTDDGEDNFVENRTKAGRKLFRDRRDAIVHTRVGTVDVRNGQICGISDRTGRPFQPITYAQLAECVICGYVSTIQVPDATLQIGSGRIAHLEGTFSWDRLVGASKGDLSPTARRSVKKFDVSDLIEGFSLRLSDGTVYLDNQSGVERRR